MAAAVGAYEAAVDSALDEAGTDGDHLTHLEAALDLHVIVLQTIADKAHEPAMARIDHAIDDSKKAVDRIKKTKAEHPNPGKPGQTEAPGSSPGETDDGQPTGGTDETAAPREGRPGWTFDPGQTEPPGG